jgi:hypothetical protein
MRTLAKPSICNSIKLTAHSLTPTLPQQASRFPLSALSYSLGPSLQIARPRHGAARLSYILPERLLFFPVKRIRVKVFSIRY